MKHRPSRNGKGRNGSSRHSGAGGRRNNSNNTINLSSAKSNYEKYITKAKEAKSSGDRVSAENLFQHAEHYKRLIIEADEKKEAKEKKEEIEKLAAQSNNEPNQESDNNSDSTAIIADKINTTPEELSI
jgi:hypothetical protein